MLDEMILYPKWKIYLFIFIFEFMMLINFFQKYGKYIEVFRWFIWSSLNNLLLKSDGIYVE